MQHYPKISIVTPSYNQGEFLEETILSVIGQGYPNLEYFIIDGGSTDNSVEIIKKYEQHLTYWQSQKDKGQTDAINIGFAKASGDILGFLNSDDMYMPGTLLYIAKQFKNPDTDNKIVFGNATHIIEMRSVAYGSDVVNAHQRFNLSIGDYITQPSSFWTKKVWDQVGTMNNDFYYIFDWEWYLRAKKIGVLFEATSKYLSIYRVHEKHKTSTGKLKRTQEVLKIIEEFQTNANIKQAVNKFYHKYDTIEKYQKILNASKITKFIDVHKLIWLLFFREVSFNEYQQIHPTCMPKF